MSRYSCEKPRRLTIRIQQWSALLVFFQKSEKLPCQNSLKGVKRIYCGITRRVEMALVCCPECGTKVSDQAVVCPFCGYRSSSKNVPMIASKTPLAKFQWESSSLTAELDQVFPISAIQSNNLNIIFSRAENLARVAPAFLEAIKAFLPKTLKVAELNPEIQRLIDSGVYRFVTDKSGEILPSIFGENGIVAQVRLRDIQLTPDLGSSIVNLQTQIALAQIISEIHDVQKGIANLHKELQDDRIALAESAWQQLQQASQIGDARVREEKMLTILSSATDAKCMLFRAFAHEHHFFIERMGQSWFAKLTDKEALNSGSEKSTEILNCLVAITRTIQVETTIYCLLGEQKAARLSMKQFSDFISANSLDDRDTLLTMNSYGNSDQKNLIDSFTDIQQKISALPLKFNEDQPLNNIINQKENNHE
jgi:hypothetical protein